MARTLTNEIITAAIAGFQAQKSAIDVQIAELRGMLTGGKTESAASAAPSRGKRRLSAAGRKAIGDAARRRWAAVNAAKAGAAEPAPASKRGRKRATKKKAAKKAAKAASQSEA